MMIETGGRGISEAVRLLRAGSLVVYPTETVYGIGARADSVEAIERIRAIKGGGTTTSDPVPDGRDREGYIVLAPSAEVAWTFSEGVPPPLRSLGEKYWPGPLTIILPGSANCVRAAASPDGSVGVRVSSDPIASSLAHALNDLGTGLVSTSANRRGETPPTDPAAVEAILGKGPLAPDLLLDDGPRSAPPSTIVAMVQGRITILRSGAIDPVLD